MHIRTPEGLTSLVDVNCGVLQGEFLSQVFLILTTSDQEIFFMNCGLRGISIDHLIKVLLLTYADDIIILDDSWIDLQRKMNALAEYCRLNYLEVNTSKTKTMVFHSARPSVVPNFTFDGNQLEMVREYWLLQRCKDSRWVDFACSSSVQVGILAPQACIAPEFNL